MIGSLSHLSQYLKDFIHPNGAGLLPFTVWAACIFGGGGSSTSMMIRLGVGFHKQRNKPYKCVSAYIPICACVY